MADGDAEGVRGRGPLDRALDRRRRQRLRPLLRHPHPELRRRQGGGARTDRAVRATRGQVATYDGEVAQTTYFSVLGRPHRVAVPRRARRSPTSRASRTPTTTTRPCTAGPSASRRREMDSRLGALRRRPPARHQGDEARRLPADRLRAADRHAAARRRSAATPLAARARPLRPLGVLRRSTALERVRRSCRRRSFRADAVSGNASSRASAISRPRSA